MEDDQVSRVTDAIDTTPPEDVAADPQQPLMPFETSLKLTLDRESELVEWCMKRHGELEQETGRDRRAHRDFWADAGYSGAESLDPLNRDRVSRTWLGKRRLFDLMANNDVDYRIFTEGGIYQKSNLSFTIVRRVFSQMVARANNYFFGSDPWFAATPVGEFDKPMADKTDRYLRWKMDKSSLKRTLERANNRAFAIGEAVVKSRWKKTVQFYKSMAEVLVVNGQPVTDANGDFIEKDAQWIVNQVEDPANPGQMMDNTGAVLKRDGVTPMPGPQESLVFEKRLVDRRLKIYEGNEAEVIHYGDFLCPLTARTVQEADCCVHIYNRPVMEIINEWRTDQVEGESAEQNLESIRKFLELMGDMKVSTQTNNTDQDADRPDEDTGRNGGDHDEPTALIGEFHIRYDADGDGITEDIMVMIDLNTRRPIFYDYLPNVTPDGLRPFSVIRATEIDNRWYGMGAMEMFEKSQNIVDLFINRMNLAQSEAGRVTFWNPGLTIEGQDDPNLRFNWGRTYTIASRDTKPEEVLSVTYLEDNKTEHLSSFMELFIQMVTNEAGVMNGNDGQMAGLDSTKLATGIRNIERSGQELFAVYLSCLEPGHQDALQKNVRLLLANIDREEVYTYFEEGEGGEGAAPLMQIQAADIPIVEMDVQVLMTRRHGEQVLVSSERACAIVEKFYSLPYLVMVQTRQFYIDQLRALDVRSPEKIIVPVNVPAPAVAPGAAAPSAAPFPAAKPSVMDGQAA